MKVTTTDPKTNRPKGFTLIEVVLGLALMALLIGGVFAVARGALSVASEVTENQQYSMKIHSYLELLRRTCEDMPGNGQVLLRPSGTLESEIAFIEYPLAFSWSGVPAGSHAVVLRTSRSPNGWLESRVFYLEEELADEYANGGRLDESAPNLLLMDQIKMLQWRFYDQRIEDWVTEWEQSNSRRPSLVELNVQFLDGSNPIAVVFWIPTVVNPEQIARSLNTGRQGGGQGAGGGRGDGNNNDGAGGDGRGGGGRDGGARGGAGRGGGGGARGGGGRAGGGGGRATGGVPGVPGAGGGR